MRVVLTVESGEMAGRRVWLQSGGATTVGRTVRADFAVPDDILMSGVHFALHCDQHVCKLSDLNSRNGTFLNRKRTTECAIRDGDRIVAGQTTFSVAVEDAPAPNLSPESPQSNPLPAGLFRNRSLLGDNFPSGEDDEILATLRFGRHGTPSASTDANSEVARVVLVYANWQGERRTWLRPGQSVTVGRTEQADFVVDHDDSLADLHFALDCERTLCRVRDLGGLEGILLNGVHVSEAIVYDRDVIQAGATQFVLQVEGGPGSPSSNERFGDIQSSARTDRLPRQRSVACTQEVCAAEGGIRFRSAGHDSVGHDSAGHDSSAHDSSGQAYSGQASSGINLARQLARLLPVYLVLDVTNLPSKLSAERVAGENLLDWLPEQSASVCSPRIVRGIDDIWDLMPRLWRDEAMICFYSQGDAEERLARLRHMARLNLSEKKSRGLAASSVFAFYRPCIMSALLVQCVQPLIGKLLAGWDAVLMSAASGKSWELFAEHALAETLRQNGIIDVV